MVKYTLLHQAFLLVLRVLTTALTPFHPFTLSPFQGTSWGYFVRVLREGTSWGYFVRILGEGAARRHRDTEKDSNKQRNHGERLFKSSMPLRWTQKFFSVVEYQSSSLSLCAYMVKYYCFSPYSPLEFRVQQKRQNTLEAVQHFNNLNSRSKFASKTS